MANANGVIQLANRRVTEMFGWSSAELFGREVEGLIPVRFRQRHPEHRGEYFNRPASIWPEARIMGRGSELYGLRKDGSEFPVEIGFISFQDGGEELVICSVIDITERRQAEEQRRRFVSLRASTRLRHGQLAERLGCQFASRAA
jgi:PAS domain S-box-containing protein